MKAGFARINITPDGPVWMAGMIRAHRSTGVHDPIFAKALALSGEPQASEACVIVSLDICGLSYEDALKARKMGEELTGIPRDQIIVAAIHNHSGPATIGNHNNMREDEYTENLLNIIASLIKESVLKMEPVMVGVGLGEEKTISHYRRLLADDGHVVMNWEPWPEERIVRVLGDIDPDVGVLKVVSAKDESRLIGLLFNHAGHPNVMSGDNYLINPDYPGRAEALLEKDLGGTAIFLNGAQGTMDIDGLKDRDWEGVDRVGGALSEAVKKTADTTVLSPDARLKTGVAKYEIPARRISDTEKKWAESIISRTDGDIQPVADGVGDDYKAGLYIKLFKAQDKPVLIEQICLAIDDCAFISFPGELFTEIGMQIKKKSPFKHTFVLGLANGYAGYVPTKKAISEGGYEPDVRRMDDSAEEIIIAQSLSLLRDVHAKTT